MGVRLLNTPFTGWILARTEARDASKVFLNKGFIPSFEFDVDSFEELFGSLEITDFGPAVSLSRNLDWLKVPEVDLRMPWVGVLARAALDLVGAINPRDLWLFRGSDCPAALLFVETVAGDFTLG